MDANPHPQLRMTRTKFDSVMESIQLEVDDRLHKLQHKAKLLKAALHLRLDLELSRHPKDIRAMRWSDFCRCAVAPVVRESQGLKKEGEEGLKKQPLRTPLKANKSALHRIASTSKSIQRKPVPPTWMTSSIVPSTPRLSVARQARLPFQMEQLLSVNGSPLVNLLATPGLGRPRESRVLSLAVPVTDKKLKSSESSTMTVDVCLENPEELKGLDSPQRQVVRQQLMEVAMKIQKLVERMDDQ